MIKHTTKFAFTLSEIMVCLAVFSIIATIMMPSINPLRPKNDRTMFKKGYNSVERAIYEMIHDEDFYPSKDSYVGLSNTEAGSAETGLAAGSNKLCNAFRLKMNSSGTCPNIKTSDGIRFNLPATPANWHTDANANAEYTITMRTADESKTEVADVDGTPNQCTNAMNPNRYTIYVKRDGKMRVTGRCARKYMEQVNLLKDDN